MFTCLSSQNLANIIVVNGYDSGALHHCWVKRLFKTDMILLVTFLREMVLGWIRAWKRLYASDRDGVGGERRNFGESKVVWYQACGSSHFSRTKTNQPKKKKPSNPMDICVIMCDENIVNEIFNFKNNHINCKSKLYF